MKNIRWITASFLFLLIIISAFGCRSVTETPSDGNKGKVVFLVSDSAADVSTFSKINMTVSNLQVHSQTQGWLTMSTSDHTYDLLDLRAKNTNKVLFATDLNAGAYDKVRLTTNKVVVVDNRGTQQASMPNNTVEMQSAFNIKSSTTATVLFDFIADQSIHATTDARYVFAPVIKIETRNDAEVQMKGNNEARVSGGQILTNTQVGMDINGNVGVGLRITPDAILSISASGITTGGTQSSGTVAIQGTLQSVNNAAGTITVRTDAGQELVLKTTSSTQIQTGGLISTLLSLAGYVGNRVQVEYDINTKTATTISM